MQYCICRDNHRYYIDGLSHVALLRICNIEQEPDTCFSARTLVCVCLQEMRDYKHTVCACTMDNVSDCKIKSN